MFRKRESRNITLQNHIKWVIGNRIAFCLALLSIAVLITSLFDIFSGLVQVKKAVEAEVEELSEFIIAQSLIDNKNGILVKLEELNQNIQGRTIEWISQKKSNKIEMKWKLPFSWVYLYPVRDKDGYSYGQIKVSGSYFYDQSILTRLITKFSLLFFFSAMIFFLLYPLSKRIPRDLFIVPIVNLLSILKQRSNVAQDDNDEILPLELHEIRIKVIELIEEITQSSQKVAFGQIAAQVAHDIRSPLAALNLGLETLKLINEKERILFRNAINRINGIANNLLIQSKNYCSDRNEVENLTLKPELILIALNSIINEKKLEYHNKNIQFTLSVPDEICWVFVKLSLDRFKRILSNLINNAIEAINYRGNIDIKFFSDTDFISIDIQDDGCGIPEDFIQDVFNKGFSYGKTDGVGLGLSYAYQQIKLFGGEIFIKSRLNVGTTITIKLPKSLPPKWFCPSVTIKNHSNIIILDDDQIIHDVWRMKLKDYPTLNLFSCYDTLHLIDVLKNHEIDLFLIDYELLGNEQNGLELISQFEINHKSVLVTSNFENDVIRQECEKLSITILPKECVHCIPIINKSIDESELYVLIDDDELIRSAWKCAANDISKRLFTFSSPEEFSVMAVNLSKSAKIYVDSELHNGIKGEDYTKELHSLGYTEIYLTTGHPKEKFQSMPWILDIVGKEPPFD